MGQCKANLTGPHPNVVGGISTKIALKWELAYIGNSTKMALKWSTKMALKWESAHIGKSTKIALKWESAYIGKSTLQFSFRRGALSLRPGLPRARRVVGLGIRVEGFRIREHGLGFRDYKVSGQGTLV